MDIKTIAQTAGGITKLARALGYKNHAHLYRWKVIPADHLIKIEEITGIPREALRPDLYTARRPELRLVSELPTPEPKTHHDDAQETVRRGRQRQRQRAPRKHCPPQERQQR